MADSSPDATPEESRDALRRQLEERLDEGSPAAAWWREHREAADPEAVRVLLPEALRRLGRRPLVAAFAERAAATAPGVWGAVPVGEWRLGEAAQVLLLAQAADAAARPYETLFRAYDLGDTETRVAALRALNFVRRGEAQEGLRLVLDAGRTYLTQLLSAAWCGNPFSAYNLDAHDFRKAVLKAFFCDVPVEGFLRLEERADEELAQSLCEYIDERLAAGRTVPRTIWSVAAHHPRPGLVARLIGNLEHPDPHERLAAARALTRARDPRALTFVTERLEREQDPDVTEALAAARTAIKKQMGSGSPSAANS